MSLLGISLLSFIVIFVLSVFYFVNRVEGEAWRGRQSEATRSAAETVSGFIGRVVDALSIVGTVESDHLASNPKELDVVLEQNEVLLEIVRTDATGCVIASISRDKSLLATLVTIPQSQWFLQAKLGNTYIGNLQLSADTRPYIIVSIPTPDGGVVAARVEMRVLWEVVQNIRFGDSGQTYVITRSGQIIAHTNPAVVLTQTTIEDHPEFALILDGSTAGWTGVFTNFEQEQVVGSTRHIEGTEWVIVTELPLAEAFASTRAAILVLGTEALILMLLTNLVVARYTRVLIVHPMEELRKGAEEIGQGNFRHRIAMKGKNEIGQLSTAFDGMARQLEERDAKILAQTELLRTSEANLRQLNLELEERVEARTLDLKVEIAERKHVEEALRDSEARYRTVLQQSLEAIYLVDAETRQLLEANSAFLDLLGYTVEEAANLTVYDIVAQDKASIDFFYSELLKGDGVQIGERCWRRKDGSKVDVEVTAKKIVQDERAMVFVVARDITKRKQAEMALRDSEERYALAVRGANDGLWDWNLKTNVLYFSPRWCSMLGLEEIEIAGDPEDWFGRVHPHDRPRVKAAVDHHINGKTPYFECEYRIQHSSKEYLWVLSRGLAVRNGNGEAYRMAGSQTDITDRKQAEDRLAYDALHDALTGLPNRALFMDRLGQRLEHAKRHPDILFAVLFLDLDRFKIINDSLGHSVGDQFLVKIAQRLQSCLRPEDTISRLGGDEFAILLNDVSEASDTIRVSERIHEYLKSSVKLERVHRSSTASVGIAIYNQHYSEPQEMLRDADLAMYRAKALGGGRSQLFDTTMYETALYLLQLEADLKLAVENKEWRIHYQPVISLETGEVTGVEALIRWNHPKRGVVSPLDFIPFAEETGLIFPIGEYVLRTACAQAKIWRGKGHPTLWISVNISGRQFQDKNLVNVVEQILKETGLPGDGLRLEITESIAMKDLAHSIRVLTALNKLGVNISLDDFGNGYSSLGYLKQFPLKVLKIDRSFIQDNGINRSSEAITSAIIFMGQTLNLEVVAEGVETQEQLNFLMSQFCNEAQGFLFGRPVSHEELTKLLNSKKNFLKL